MKNLIEALQIFAKYMEDVDLPTHCEHDELFVMVDPAVVSKEDKKRLKTLTFTPSSDGDTFSSFYYGSA
jgi:hypothetical protein